ncbi:hypothetical protein ACN4EE_06245 [Geminocystis sp. CENA526]|uniref:hypothetical protein n=1 Tax=Geminocystis sp. CENA526 TaxID=1355871 RepID=UPI003D6F51A1
MKTVIQGIIGISSIALNLISSSNLSAVAGNHIWQGTGRIINGAGEGSTVELTLRIVNNEVTFLSGPSQNERIILRSASPLIGEGKTKAGSWQVLQTEEKTIGVTLAQENPYRLIRYILKAQS